MLKGQFCFSNKRNQITREIKKKTKNKKQLITENEMPLNHERITCNKGIM